MSALTYVQCNINPALMAKNNEQAKRALVPSHGEGDLLNAKA
jgi:hypothetical protein